MATNYLFTNYCIIHSFTHYSAKSFVGTIFNYCNNYNVILFHTIALYAARSRTEFRYWLTGVWRSGSTEWPPSERHPFVRMTTFLKIPWPVSCSYQELFRKKTLNFWQKNVQNHNLNYKFRKIFLNYTQIISFDVRISLPNANKRTVLNTSLVYTV